MIAFRFQARKAAQKHFPDFADRVHRYIYIYVSLIQIYTLYLILCVCVHMFLVLFWWACWAFCVAASVKISCKTPSLKVGNVSMPRARINRWRSWFFHSKTKWKRTSEHPLTMNLWSCQSFAILVLFHSFSWCSLNMNIFTFKSAGCHNEKTYVQESRGIIRCWIYLAM